MKATSIPKGEKSCDDFLIKIDGERVPAYAVRVSAMPFNTIWPGRQRDLNQTEEAGVLSFATDRPARIEVTVKREFKEVVVRPLSKRILPAVSGKTVSFTIEEAGQYSLEFDGRSKPLMIFANPEEEWKIDERDKNVIYFGAGVHDVGLIELTDNQTLYIDQDAVVYGYVRAIQAKNIRIIGYGILDGSNAVRTDNTMLVPQDISRRNPEVDVYTPFLKKYPVAEVPKQVVGTSILQDKESFIRYLEEVNMLQSCMQIYGCENVEIGGITMRDSVGFTCIIANCINAVCDNVKLVGMWRYNADGIDFFNCKKCAVKNSFLRNFDDCIVLKGIIGWDEWSMEDILIENCVLWCDWGRALEIGAETAAPEYKNIIFRNCDIIHASCVALDLHHHDRAHIHHVYYDDIRVEYSKYDAQEQYQESADTQYTWRHGLPVFIMIVMPKGRGYSNDFLKGQVRDIYYTNIQVLTDNEEEVPPILLYGHDEGHTIARIYFDGITINGKNYPMECVQKNGFVSELIIK